MTKAAIIISAILVFAGVAAASSLPGLGGSGSNTPTLDTPPLAATTNAATTTNAGNDPAAEDVSGPCDEAENANDPRCAGVTAEAQEDDAGEAGDQGRDSENRGPGGGDSGDDQGGDSGPGSGGDDD